MTPPDNLEDDRFHEGRGQPGPEVEAASDTSMERGSPLGRIVVIPFGYVASVAELDLFVPLVLRSLGMAAMAGELSMAAAIHNHLSGGDWYAEDVDHIERLEEFGRQQEKRGYPIVFHLVVVRLWTLLETMMDDVVAAVLAHDPSLASEEALKVSGPLLPFVSASPEERTDTLMKLLKDRTAAPLKRGVGRFEALLACVGLSGSVDPSARKILFELSEVRNCVVHRKGVCDRRLAESCPWLGLEVGEPVTISPDRFRSYVRSFMWYVYELDQRLRKRLDQPHRPGIAEQAAKFRESIPGDLATWLETGEFPPSPPRKPRRVWGPVRPVYADEEEGP